MPAQVRFTKSALSDLQAIQIWYTEQGVPDVGARLVGEIIKRIERLVHHPDMGRVVPEFGQIFLREIIQTLFRIVYRRDPKTVRIVRIWRSERQFRLTEHEDKPT